MSRNKDYQRLLNSKRWKQLRQWKLRHDPLCELCRAKGLVVSAIDVHHIDPCEDARSLAEMEEKCFRVSNLQSLCIPCHIKVHQDMRTHSKEKVAENKARARQRFMELNDPNYKPQDNDNTGT